MKEKRWVFLFDSLSILRFPKRNRNGQKIEFETTGCIDNRHIIILDRGNISIIHLDVS